MRAYLAFAEKKFKSSAAYRFDNIMGVLYSLLNVFIYMSIYQVMYGTKTEYEGITLSMLGTNFVLTFVVGKVFSLDDSFINSKVRDGSIVNEFLRPVSLRLRLLFESIGESAYSLIFQGVPTIIIVYVIYRFEEPKNLLCFVQFFISLVLGYLILWSISFIVQMISFFIINVWSVSTIKNVFINILAGVYLPVYFFPETLQTIVSFTPFEGIYYLPLQFYFGNLSIQQMIISYTKQIIWIFILLLIGDVLYRKGKKKLIVQGG